MLKRVPPTNALGWPLSLHTKLTLRMSWSRDLKDGEGHRAHYLTLHKHQHSVGSRRKHLSIKNHASRAKRLKKHKSDVFYKFSEKSTTASFKGMLFGSLK